MTDNDRRKSDDLAAAIHAAAEPLVENGEVIVGWVVLAATRDARDGGTVLVIPGDRGMPGWAVKGMLTDGLDTVRAAEQTAV